MVKIYIEGEPPQPESAPKENAVANLGGLFDTDATETGNLQEAFTRLFEQAALLRQVHTVVMSGGTTAAMKAFAQAVTKGENAYLLIDIDEKTKAHHIIAIQDKIIKADPNANKTAFDDRIFFMELETEAWFLYEDMIERWYKTQQTDIFVQKNANADITAVLANALQGKPPCTVENPDKKLDALLKTCFTTQRKAVTIAKGYKSKVKDGSAFLRAIKIGDLQQRFTEINRLIETLKTT